MYILHKKHLLIDFQADKLCKKAMKLMISELGENLDIGLFFPQFPETLPVEAI